VTTSSATPGSGAFALLGLLSVQPFSTYELAKQVERSLGWFWPRTERKVYDEARKLVDVGLAAASSEPTGKRGRTVYSITPAGRDALAVWLRRPSAPLKLESESLVRLFFADAGSIDDMRQTLVQMAADTRARAAELDDKLRAFDQPDYPFVERRHINVLNLQFQIVHHAAIIEWCQWALDQVESWPSSTDPGKWDWRTPAPR
jgi:PadR family transcriptional regulator, regulatory protein AphA